MSNWKKSYLVKVEVGPIIRVGNKDTQSGKPNKIYFVTTQGRWECGIE